MDTQSTLTLAIEIVFWAMILLMINDFVTGIFMNFTQPQYTVIPAQIPSPVAEINDIPNPVVVESEAPQEYQPEEIPDPWKLEVETHTTTEPQTVVIPFPTLRLLPPAQEVQPQPKRRGRPKKSGDSIQPTAKTESRKRGRPRKSA
ncbi:hypothetical protein [Nostoc sp. CCY0012]|uniref:hypothetical protein n=1 Tax=Nostoc sp. CCY0012 TaxID=1056123 RepID=UPI0039C72B17